MSVPCVDPHCELAGVPHAHHRACSCGTAYRDDPPLASGDIVTTDFTPRYSHVERRVRSVYRTDGWSQSGWTVDADGPGGGVCADADWFTLVRKANP